MSSRSGRAPLAVAAADVLSAAFALGVSRWPPAAQLKRVLNLVGRPGAPLTVRVGSTSPARMWWVGLDRPAPAGVMSIGPSWLVALRTVAASVSARVVLTVNLANDDPASRLCRAARAPPTDPTGLT